MTRRQKSLAAFLIPALFLLGTGVGLKSIILRQIRARIDPSFHYANLRLSVVPLAFVVEDIRTVAASPFFSASKITVRLSYLTLLKRSKSLRIFIEQPVLRIYETPSAAPKGKLKLDFSLPFSIENGVVRDGEIYYWTKGASYSAKGIKVVFRQKKEAFTLRLESADNSLMLDTLGAPLTGKVTASLERKGKDVIFRNLNIEGSEFFAKVVGVLSNLDDPQVDFQAGGSFPANLIADLFDLPFKWAGQARGEGRFVRRQGRAVFQADLSSDDMVLNSVALGRVEGKVTAGGEDGGRVELSLQKRPYPKEFVDIAFGKGKVSGIVKGVHLDPISRYLKLPWPVKSPVWGDFSVENKRLQARAEFKDDLLIVGPGRFPFSGLVDLTWDGIKNVRFSSQKLESSFGAFGVEGDIDIGRTLRIIIRGNVQDVIQGREFTSLILKENFAIPEIRGKGQAEIKILGNYRAPQIKADFSLAPGGFDNFNAASVGGLLEIVHKEVTGIFKVTDPDMRGDIRLLSVPGSLDVQIRAEDANLEKILPSLNIRIPLKGRVSGDFALSEKKKVLLLKGTYSSPRVKLLEQDLGDVRGKLEWAGATKALAFSDLQARLYGGQLKGSGSVGFKSREFDLDLEAANVDLSSFYAKVNGRLSFNLKGKGSLDSDSASGKFAIKNIQTVPIEEAEAGGDLELNYLNGRLNVKLKGMLDPGRNDFSVTFGYPLPDKSYSVNLSGHLFNLDLFLPWKGAQGEINYLAEIKGSGAEPQVSGVVDFKGPIFPFPEFAHALTDYSGLVFVQNNKASIRSVQGKLGGGDVTGTGEIRFGKGRIEFMDVQADGKNMVLAFLERTRALADGSLHLLKDETRFSLSGDFLIKTLSWKREFSEKFIFSSNPYLEPKKEKGIFNGLALDIRLHGEDNAVLENSLGRVQGRFDLTITGNIDSPIILGDIEGLKGDVYFQDRTFRVLRARLSFFNPTSVEPYLDFQGETFLKDYRVTFSLSGLINRLRPEFASSPPLPPEDVLALLALGESFKRTYSYDTSSQLGTGSLLSFQIAEEAKKRAERLFSLDRFRIDPFVLGASTEMTARLTVGKKISRNIILLYSTNLTSQREEIVRLEWEFSESFSLVGMRDERGRLSFDAKIRKRF